MIDIGTTVGNYIVRSKIGEGGMGFVFMAEHPLIGRRVAIKVIHPDYARNPEAVSRFFTEAQSVNRIGHPNIVDITDFGQSPEGDCYFVMEFLQGESLAARLRRGRMSIPEAVHVAAQIADALAASHQTGILHRDLKPDNVYLVQRGAERNFVKVLDFGLAKLTGGDSRVSHKTQMGAVMGTPFYMAPEQCAGRADIDGRADMYALAIMMFEMLVGKVPFTGDGYGEIIVKHLMHPAPRVSSLAPDVPPWLDEAIARCLEKDPNARVQTMAELRDFLAQAAMTLSATGSRPPFAATTGSQPGLPRGSQPGVAPKSQPGLNRGSQPPAAQPISSMGLAVGETGMRSRPPQRRSSRWLWGSVAVVAVAGAVTGILISQRGPKRTASVPDSTPLVDPDPAPQTPPPDPPPPIENKKVTVHLESDPTGAVVTLAGGAKLGTTPFDWVTDHSSTAVELVFRLAEHEEKRRAIMPDQSHTIVVAMAPIAPPAAEPAEPTRDRSRDRDRSRSRDRDRDRDRGGATTTTTTTTPTTTPTTTTRTPKPDDEEDLLDPTTYGKPK